MTSPTARPNPPPSRAPAPGPTVRHRAPVDLDLRELLAALRRVVRGEVRFDPGSRGAYATDASNYRQVPIGVVVPRDGDDVEVAVAACRTHGAPILGRGGGTSLAGQCCNAAVVFDFSKYMHRVLDVDPDRRTAHVQPGVTLDDLRAVSLRHGLTFGPDPATHDRCTLGGMIGNNSCGVHSILAGKTVDNVTALEILTQDGLRTVVGPTSPEQLDSIVDAGGRRGELYAGLRVVRDRYSGVFADRAPDIPRRVSGFNLEQLLPAAGFHVARALVGTESTCALTLEATVQLVPAPAARALVVVGFADVVAAARAVPAVMTTGPIGLEGFDDIMVRLLREKGRHRAELGLLPQGNGWLYAEYAGATREEALDRAGGLADALRGVGGAPHCRVVTAEGVPEKLWAIRESALGINSRLPQGDAWGGWEDSAVPPDRLGDYLADLRGLYDSYGYFGSFYGHFGHGCVHARVTFDLATPPGIATFESFLADAADLCVSYGGSLSGEHGDGQARGALLARMYGAEVVDGFRAFKRVFDPDERMNPGKVVSLHGPAYGVADDLRLGTDYAPPPGRTAFAFAEDGGDFARATLRCVGIGKCRRTSTGDGEVMCPSYQVTREEEHSTRGRARLLFELLAGDPVTGGWRNPAVRDALDLCLSCKGCRSDCPTGVDMATYKAEFLAHHYAGRLRPRSAYAIGLIMDWARLAARAPTAANGVLAAPGLGRLAKAVAGVAPGREVPPFAAETFTGWWARRGGAAVPAGPRVLLWPDTFTNHFAPQIGRAAVRVLQAAGCTVVVPQGRLCCGRPLYDFGFLRRARRELVRIVAALRPEIRAGTPLVGLEPSCVAVFRDELTGLLPADEDAHRLAAQTHTLAEYLTRARPDWSPPRVGGAAVVQTHCHQHAVMGFDADRALMERAGLAAEVLDSGCCGMAGAFGFQAEHYTVSMACGERVLLPAVRGAPAQTRVVADGFSCREQIRQGSGRRARHLAEVLAEGLGGDAG